MATPSDNLEERGLMTDTPARKHHRPPVPRSAASGQRPEVAPPLRMSADQEELAPKLARARMLSNVEDADIQRETWRVAERAMYNRRARQVLGLDGGPRGRPKQLGGVGDVGQTLSEEPELRKTIRQLFEDVRDLWSGATIEVINGFSDELAEAALREFTGIDPGDLSKWLDTVLLVGAAAVPSPGSRLQPIRLTTREQFLAVSQLTDQGLAALERELGKVGNAEALMVSGIVMAQDQGVLGEPIGIVAGTTHQYDGRQALGVGRVAVRADLDDVAAGHGKEGDPIYHAVRSTAYFVAASQEGEQRLVRALTLPLVAPADLWALKEGDAQQRSFTRGWLSGCGLTELVEREEVSCTAQQAHAARRLHDEYVERTGQTPPIVIPAIRIEQARSHRKFSSPIGPYTRELPGNQIMELRLMHRILGPKARVWLAEAGVEDAAGEGGRVEPNWRIRRPNSKPFVPGGTAILYPDLFEWAEVFTFENQLQLSELENPVALSFSRSEDMVLLQAVGEPDAKSNTRPAMWFVASRSLRSHPDLADEVGELLLRLHGSKRDSATLRDARLASFAAPARVLGGRAKKAGPWLTRELERELAWLASLMRDEDPRDPAPPAPGPHTPENDAP